MSAEQGAFMQNLLLSSRKFEEEKKYWLSQLSGELQFSMFPGENKAVSPDESIREEMCFAIPASVSEHIFRISGRSESGTFILLLAGVMYLLHRYLDHDDITVGIPSTSGTEQAGQWSAIRLNFDEVHSFKELVLKLKSLVGSAQKFNHLSLDKMLGLLGYQENNLPKLHTFVQMHSTESNVIKGPAPAEMLFSFQISQAGLMLNMNYDAGLYSLSTIERLVDHLMSVLSTCTAHPEETLDQVNLLSLQEAAQQKQRNNTELQFSEDRTIIQMFQSWVVQQPDAPAVFCDERMLTYQELDQHSDHLARHLRSQGVGTDAIVGILLQRSEDMLVAMLGVLKAGAAYMPLDPSYADHRLQYMLEDSQASVLLTQSERIDSLMYTGQVIDIAGKEQWGEMNMDLPAVSLKQLAYLIYTSGSSGKPKGVMIEHCALRNFVEGVSRVIPLETGKRILTLTTFSFDIFVLETLGSLANGLGLVMAREEDQLNPGRIAQLIRKHDVELLQITPSRLRMLQIGLAEDSPMWGQLRILMIGGEALPQALYKDVSSLTPARIYNMYGPTETTVWSTIKELVPNSPITIGHPIANTRIYILDKRHRHMPAGATGELCIAGDSVARGYWNRPELTLEKFVNDPFHEGAYMYKTGDLARLNTDGEVEYLGRSDFQVKVRGYRIELGEIENRLLQYPAISGAAVAVRADHEGESLLSAYYTVKEDQSMSLEQLRDFLLTELPEYMLPSTYTLLEQLPYTANGKLDRKALPDPMLVQPMGHVGTPPTDALERLLAQLWSDLLQLKEIDIHARFFDIGGHSLNVIKLEAMMEKWDMPLTAEDVVRHETIESLAEMLRSKGYEAKEYNIPIEPFGINVDGLERDDPQLQSTQEAGATEESVQHVSSLTDVSEVIIAGIEPFNDVFYKNCFYNSLFPVLNFYNIGVLPVMINDRMQYQFEPSDGLLHLKYQAVLSDELLMERMGLMYEMKRYCEDILRDILEALRLQRPVIIRVDCYYESLRKDMYLSTHWPHSLLIYGLDLERQIFHVIEHDHRDNLSYQRMEMPFKDIELAYEGFVRHFLQEEDVPTFYAFSCIAQDVSSNRVLLKELRYEFTKNIRLTPVEIDQEMQNLQWFIEKIGLIQVEESADLAYAELVLESLVHIVNAKKVETYRMKKLYDHHEPLVDAARTLQHGWSDVRNALAKSVYTGALKHNQWKKIYSKLEAVQELERHHLIHCSRLETSHD